MIVVGRFWLSASVHFSENERPRFSKPVLGGELLFERFEPTDEHAVADLSDHRLFGA